MLKSMKRHQWTGRIAEILLIFCLTGEVLAQPDTLWTRRYDGGYNDWSMSISTDIGGNFIVTGASNNGTSNDYFTIKFNSDGDTLWTRRYDAQGFAWGVATDLDTNVIITGYTFNGIDLDYLTFKLSPNGDTIWSKRYDSGFFDTPASVSTDQLNNIIVTGTSNDDWFTIKYNPNGDTLWTGRYDSGNYDAPWDVTTDRDSNIVVVGQVFNSVDYDIFLIKYNPDGNIIWTRTYDSGNDDEGNGVTTDSLNNVIVSGSFRKNAPDSFDLYVIKYSQAGDTLWIRIYDSGFEDEALDVTTDPDGNIISAGYSYNGTDSDYFLIKYSSQGDLLWTLRYDNGLDDFCAGIVIDANRNIAVTGWTYNGSNTDYFTIKYAVETKVIESGILVDNLQSVVSTKVYPNPFYSSTTIRYFLSKNAHLQISVYNIKGQLVKQLLNQSQNSGYHSVKWNGKNALNRQVSPGIYFYKLRESNGIERTGKVLLLR